MSPTGIATLWRQIPFKPINQKQLRKKYIQAGSSRFFFKFVPGTALYKVPAIAKPGFLR